MEVNYLTPFPSLVQYYVNHANRVIFTKKNSPTYIIFLENSNIGGVYKPRGQTRGVAQMTTTLNNSYLVKLPKFCPRGLYTPPYGKKFPCLHSLHFHFKDVPILFLFV